LVTLYCIVAVSTSWKVWLSRSNALISSVVGLCIVALVSRLVLLVISVRSVPFWLASRSNSRCDSVVKFCEGVGDGYGVGFCCYVADVFDCLGGYVYGFEGEFFC